MKNNLKIYLLASVFMLLNIYAYSQSNRIINQDTIFYSSNNWNTKIGSQLIPFDSTNLIIQFEPNSNKLSIINFLQSNSLELIDSLAGFYLCRLDSNWTLNRSYDTLSNSNFLYPLN